MRLALAKIRCDGGTQPRATLDESTVDSYKEAVESGAKFPPIVVFYDGAAYWLADGFHRFVAWEELGRDTIDADVRQGTQRDAILFSCGANALHGLPRTNADKRRAVTTLLRDDEWSRKSDRWIAEKAAVSHPLVIKLRAEIAGGNGYHLPPSREGRDGKSYPAKPERPAPTLPFDRPAAPAAGPHTPAEPSPSAPLRKGGDPRDAAEVIPSRPVDVAPPAKTVEEETRAPSAIAPLTQTPGPFTYSSLSARDTAAAIVADVRRVARQFSASDWRLLWRDLDDVRGSTRPEAAA